MCIRDSLTPSQRALGKYLFLVVALFVFQVFLGGFTAHYTCLLYTSDAADERSSVDLGGRRIIKKKKNSENSGSVT